MKKNLLILGGSKISTEIVNQAQKMNLKTFVTDYYPLEKSPAKQIADVALYSDTTNLELQLKDIKEYSIDGVITGFTDSTLPMYVDITENANLPSYANKEQIHYLNNKYYYKELCREFKVPTTEEFSIDLSDENSYHSIDYPIIVKPVDSSGAKGVFIVKNKEELLDKCKESIRFSTSKKLLVEKYYDTEEITAFFYIKNGDVYLTSVADRIVDSVNDSTIKLPTGYIFPSKHTDIYKQNVLPKITKMFKSLNIRNGMIFTQCLVDGDNIRLYDLGFRLTGSLEFKLFEQMYGFNTLEMLINYAIYEDDKEPELEYKLKHPLKAYGANITFLAKPGTVKKIEGLDDVKNHPDVIDVYLNYTENHVIPIESKGTLNQVAARVFIVSEDKNKLYSCIEYCQQHFAIYNEMNESLIISELKVEIQEE